MGERFEGDLRRTILDAAVALIAEVGADRLSLREVARRIGVSHAAPAHHFTDKSGLLTTIAVEGFDRFTESMRSVSEPVSTDEHGVAGLVRLSELGRVYIRFAEQHPAHFEVMFRPSLVDVTDPELVRASDAALAELRAQVERCQHDGWRADLDTDLVATALWALVHGLSVLRASGSLEPRHPGATSADLLTIAAAIL